MEPKDTNRKFSKTDETFKAACLLAGIPSSAAQARKWRNSRGFAFAANKFQGKKNLSSLSEDDLKLFRRSVQDSLRERM